MSTTQTPLWELQARQWSRIKPPLRPSAEDVIWAQEAVDRCQMRCGGMLRAMVLGATAELASLQWSADSEVTGLDLSSPMLTGVWLAAPTAPGRRLAVEGNWLQMPFPEESFDLVFGDGSFSLVRQSEGSLLSSKIQRVLRRGGMLSLRAFIRPDIAKPPATVWQELLAGRIGNFGIFKFRLLMSLAAGNGEVWVADAWEYFHARCSSVEALAQQLGWAVDEIATIESYRGQRTFYWFPTLAELRASLAHEFVERACQWPSYEMGDRCPTFTLLSRR